jgi:hypothetical protein
VFSFQGVDAMKNYDREEARKAYLARKAYFAGLQPALDKNFKEAKSEEELLAADGKAIKQYISKNHA